MNSAAFDDLVRRVAHVWDTLYPAQSCDGPARALEIISAEVQDLRGRAARLDEALTMWQFNFDPSDLDPANYLTPTASVCDTEGIRTT
jgi:hypothetical protein